MQGRHLDVTACTTFDHLVARSEGDSWAEDAIAVLDVTSPADETTVSLGLELDPGGLEHLPHHVDYVPLSPEQARTLAAELREVARAAERGDAASNGRG
ncbi:DUF6360 family protein [Natrinema halophilum]|uniref:Uncharacterized protein n=1 Tax=Natrinema halophilum TaxID=1699371 RepID=A0A7D5K756_9EURY|nr:DUF6360 family protein [Natrinema halophilum]QLG49703.1 DUF6360 family protein [Natrinema halophilum]